MPDYSNNKQKIEITRISARDSKANRNGVDGPIKRGQPYYHVKHWTCIKYRKQTCPGSNLVTKFYAKCPSLSDLGLNQWGWRIQSKRFDLLNGNKRDKIWVDFKYHWWTGVPVAENFVTVRYTSATLPIKSSFEGSHAEFKAAATEESQKIRKNYALEVKPATFDNRKLSCGSQTGSNLYYDPCPYTKVVEQYVYHPVHTHIETNSINVRFGGLLEKKTKSALPTGYSGKIDDDISEHLRPFGEMNPDGVKEKFLGTELGSVSGLNTNQTNPEHPLSYDARVGTDYQVNGWENDVLGNSIVQEERWTVMSTTNDTGDSTHDGMWRYKIAESDIETDARPRRNKEIMFYPVGHALAPGHTFYRKLHLIPDDYVGGPYSTTVDETGMTHNYDPDFGS